MWAAARVAGIGVGVGSVVVVVEIGGAVDGAVVADAGIDAAVTDATTIAPRRVIRPLVRCCRVSNLTGLWSWRPSIHLCRGALLRLSPSAKTSG
jgi:hypothetical protein